MTERFDGHNKSFPKWLDLCLSFPIWFSCFHFSDNGWCQQKAQSLYRNGNMKCKQETNSWHFGKHFLHCHFSSTTDLGTELRKSWAKNFDSFFLSFHPKRRPVSGALAAEPECVWINKVEKSATKDCWLLLIVWKRCFTWQHRLSIKVNTGLFIHF